MSALESRLRTMMLASLAGDARAYRLLLEELSHYLRAYFLRRLGHGRQADAEDLVQETLMAIHAKRATYDVERPFTAWLHAVAKYKLADHFRKNGKRVHVSLDDAGDLFAPDDVEAATAHMDVHRLLETVSPASRTLIHKVRLEGQSIEDVAQSSGMSQSAVKVGIHRALKRVAARLKGSSN